MQIIRLNKDKEVRFNQPTLYRYIDAHTEHPISEIHRCHPQRHWMLSVRMHPAYGWPLNLWVLALFGQWLTNWSSWFQKMRWKHRQMLWCFKVRRSKPEDVVCTEFSVQVNIIHIWRFKLNATASSPWLMASLNLAGWETWIVCVCVRHHGWKFNWHTSVLEILKISACF